MGYSALTTLNVVTICHQSYCSIIDYVTYATSISVIYVFYNSKCVPLNPIDMFCPSPHPSPLWQPTVYFLYLWVRFCCFSFVNRDPLQKTKMYKVCPSRSRLCPEILVDKLKYLGWTIKIITLKWFWPSKWLFLLVESNPFHLFSKL